MIVHRRAWRTAVVTAVLTALTTVLWWSTTTPAGTAAAQQPACLRDDAGLSPEERRLTARMALTVTGAGLQAPFSEQMIARGGFGDVTPRFVARICGARTAGELEQIVREDGRRLWERAVDRAQGRIPPGSLPASDDRPLYWTRLASRVALLEARFSFPFTRAQRARIEVIYDEAARGASSIRLPAGRGVKRVILSGFDPFGLREGNKGEAAGAAPDGLRTGNPAGAVALSMDGTRRRLAGGKVARVETYILPVDWRELTQGYLEDTVGPFMRRGRRQVDASITMSQGEASQFNLEQFNGRYRGTAPDNRDVTPCPPKPNRDQTMVENRGCVIKVVNRWGGPGRFSLRNPPQFTRSSLPIGRIIRARTGAGVPRPPRSDWSDRSVAFGAVWHTIFGEFPNCRKPKNVTRNDVDALPYPPRKPPVAPRRTSCARAGGGGDFLSNESGYRNTLLRDRLRARVAAGHIHTPDMQQFAGTNPFGATDPIFEAQRDAIVRQSQRMVDVIARYAP